MTCWTSTYTKKQEKVSSYTDFLHIKTLTEANAEINKYIPDRWDTDWHPLWII